MAHIFKTGDKVILGRHIDDWQFAPNVMSQYLGKVAILDRTKRIYDDNDKPSWYVKMADGTNNPWYWHEDVMKFTGCPCNIKICLTHAKKKQ